MPIRFARIALCGLFALLPSIAPAESAAVATRRAPEFPRTVVGDWLNSAPLTLAGLRGRPVLIEFWTFDCVNCLRTVPWMRHVAATFRERGLAVHTPEFQPGRDPDNVRAAVERLGIDYPVLLDPGFRYWHALGNRYWPAFYLLDQDGRIITTAVGEMHSGTARAIAFEQKIEELVGSQ